jgi:hypothetical protein
MLKTFIYPCSWNFFLSFQVFGLLCFVCWLICCCNFSLSSINIPISFVNKKEEQHSLQNDINNRVHWSDKWLLKFNKSKCKYVHLGHATNTKRNPTFDYCPLQACTIYEKNRFVFCSLIHHKIFPHILLITLIQPCCMSHHYDRRKRSRFHIFLQFTSMIYLM